MWRCVVDSTINASLRIVFGEEGLVEVDHWVFKVRSGSESGAEHLRRDVSEKRCDGRREYR